MSFINRDGLHHLAKLARIELNKKEEDSLLADLEQILGYFEELKSLDTSTVQPVSGGTDRFNILRPDDASLGTDQGAGPDQFPDYKDGFLKVPPVFK